MNERAPDRAPAPAARRTAWRAAGALIAAALLSACALAPVPSPGAPDDAAAASPAPLTPPPITDPAEADRLARALQRASDAVVGVEVRAVEGARSARSLGEARRGSGVLIDEDGTVLTIGYLVMEAEQVDLVLDDRRRIPARPLAYDVGTGLGLVQSLVPPQRLGLEPVPLGEPARTAPTEPLMVVSGGEGGQVTPARLRDRREFAGYWEYLIDGALFTAPARPDHSGAGLFNGRGELLGVGSLVVADAGGPGRRQPGNMFVPVDLLRPVLDEMRRTGRVAASTRPWLGLSCTERAGVLTVIRVAEDSPAELAGLAPGDEVLAIDGGEVKELSAFYRRLWRAGDPRRDVVLDVRRDGERRSVTLQAVEREATLRRPQGI
jgi:S1-C subfamily serine protease